MAVEEETDAFDGDAKGVGGVFEVGVGGDFGLDFVEEFGGFSEFGELLGGESEVMFGVVGIERGSEGEHIVVEFAVDAG